MSTFPFEEIMYGKTPPAFEPNLQTSKDMVRHVAESETNILQRNLSFGVKMFAKRWAF